MSTDQTYWRIDPAASRAEFSIRELGFMTVKGNLGPVTGAIVLDEDNLAASHVVLAIDVAGVSTGNGRRDADLRSAHFFDVAQFPTITFRGAATQRTQSGALRVTGDLHVHGVRRSLNVEVHDDAASALESGGRRLSYIITARLDRRDFGMRFAPGALIAHQVDVQLRVEALKIPADQAGTELPSATSRAAQRLAETIAAAAEPTCGGSAAATLSSCVRIGSSVSEPV